MIIELDAGNTRIKWRVVNHQGQVLHAVKAAVSEDGLLQMLSELDFSKLHCTDANMKQALDRIRLASVRGAEDTSQLARRLEELFLVPVERAMTAKKTGVIQNSYSQAEAMGVDRWSAIVSAADHLKSEEVVGEVLGRLCCVVSAGTALTIDFVRRDGMHVGGYILPGYRLQIHSLLNHTDRVGVDGGSVLGGLHPANNTSSAVKAGVLKALTSLINTSVEEFAGSEDVAIFLSGGDAGLLVDHIDRHVMIEHELVLDGLRLLLP